MKLLSLFFYSRSIMKSFLFLLISVIPLLVLGQDTIGDKISPKKERIFFEGSAGVSVPFGSYSKFDRMNKTAGFAGTGYLFQLTGTWMGKRDLGLAVQYSYQWNSLVSSAQDGTLVGRTYPIGGGGWSNHYLMLGGVYNKQIKNFMVNVKLMGGLVFAFSPLFNYTSIDSLHQKTTGYGSGFAYQVAVAGGYSISPRWHLKLEVGVLGGIPTFHKQYGGEFLRIDSYIDPQTHAINYYYVYAPAILLDLKNYINTFNASFGIIFKL
jgi:hypothetical protein